MAKVAPPIIETQIRNAALRPRMSPTRPKISAPSGRKAKPTPNSASAAIWPAIGSSWAKKVLAMIACRLPKMKKSYHSNAVPAAEAATTVRMGVVAGVVDAWVAGAPCATVSIIRPPVRAGLALARRFAEAGPMVTTLYIDADACPVKDEVYKVAVRYQLPV